MIGGPANVRSRGGAEEPRVDRGCAHFAPLTLTGSQERRGRMGFGPDITEDEWIENIEKLKETRNESATLHKEA